MNLLGIDPGFASLGWAVARVDDDGPPTVLGLGVLRTTPEHKKRRIFVADDDCRRVDELWDGLDLVASSWHPAAICVEAPQGSKGAKAAGALGIAKALIACFRRVRRLPSAWCSPQDLKKKIGGAKNAADESVILALAAGERVRWTEQAQAAADRLPKTVRCHAFDALGAIVVCRDSDIVRAVLQRGNGATIGKVEAAEAC